MACGLRLSIGHVLNFKFSHDGLHSNIVAFINEVKLVCGGGVTHQRSRAVSEPPDVTLDNVVLLVEPEVHNFPNLED